CVWPGVGAGTYTLKAIAIDANYMSGTSQTVTVTVNQPGASQPAPSTTPPSANVPPVVTLTSPANGGSMTAPATISLSANASDGDGTVTQVSFFSGSTLIASLVKAPYVFGWNGVPAGTYTLTARATDNSGATTTSTPVTVSVSGG